MPLAGPDPPLLREHHGDGLGGDQRRLVHGLGGLALHDGRAAGVAELLRVGGQLVAHLAAQAGVGAENLRQRIPLLDQIGLLGADLHLFELGEVPQLQLQDGLGLGIAQVEALHELRLGPLLGADDADHLVDVEVGDQIAVENVEPRQNLVIAELEAPPHGFDAELEPIAEQLPQGELPRPAVEADHGQVHPVGAFEVRGGEEMGHQALDIHAVRARSDHQPRRVFVIGFVPQILHHGELLGLHLVGDLAEDLVPRNLERQGGDDDVALFHLKGGPQAERSGTGLVDLPDFGPGRDDLRVIGKIGTLDGFVDLIVRDLGIVEQLDARPHDLAHVVRRNVGRHAHGDARGPVQEHVRQPRRHELGLLERAVEIRAPFHRSLFQLGKEGLGERRHPRLGVAHGGERLGIVLRAPVPLAVDQRIPQAERLRHEHHGLIAGRVAVRMVFAEHVAHGAGRLLEFRAWPKGPARTSRR